MTVWTSNLTVRWRPELRFFEKRYDYLRRLSDLGVRQAFKVEPNSVAAKFGAQAHQVTIGVDYLSIEVVTPRPQDEQISLVLDEALKMLQPEGLTLTTLSQKHLVPLEGSYDDLRASAAKQLLTRWQPPEVKDWSLLADIEFPESNLGGQVEFGLVDRLEMPERLAGVAGRNISGSGPTRLNLEEEHLPDVAIFVDSYVLGPAANTRTEAVTSKAVLEFARTASDRVSIFVEDLKAALAPDDRSSEMGTGLKHDD